MEIKIKYKSPDTKRLEIKDQSDWVDLSADERVTMMKDDYKIIPLGIAMELPFDYEAYIVPRSSTFKNFGIIQVNHFGVVDNSYCGNDDWWGFACLAMRDTVIERGNRICQFRIQKKQPAFYFAEVDNLNKKSRGGFGSSGI